MGFLFIEEGKGEISDKETDQVILDWLAGKDTDLPGFVGISVIYNKSTRNLLFSSWYDGNCGGAVGEISLQDFLSQIQVEAGD